MSQGDFVIVKNKIELEKRLPFILKRLEDWDYTQPLCVKFEQYDNPRTLSQNAFFISGARRCRTFSSRKFMTLRQRALSG
jgi:hypothetical protein